MILVDERLVEDVFAAFTTVLPERVAMEKKDRGLTAEWRGRSDEDFAFVGVGYRGVFLVSLPIPMAYRLELAIRGFVRTLADLVAEALDEPWPAARPHIRVVVESELIQIWFGQLNYADAALKLPVVPRRS